MTDRSAIAHKPNLKNNQNLKDKRFTAAVFTSLATVTLAAKPLKTSTKLRHRQVLNLNHLLLKLLWKHNKMQWFWPNR